MLRVYLEDFDQSKGLWTVDYGDPSTAQRFEKVLISVLVWTNYDLSQDNIKNPKCWMEVPDGVLKVIGSVAVIRHG